MIFRNRILDRIYTGFSLLAAWSMAALMVYAAFFATPTGGVAWQWFGYIIGAMFPIMALIITFPVGMLRYTLTGDDFTNGWF